jgi:glycosyltransferase involved in cell wall biosynthesis
MEKFCRFLVQSLLDDGWPITVALSGENIYGDLVSPRAGLLNVQHVDWLDNSFAGDREYQASRVRARRRWFRRIRPDVAVFVQSSNTPLRASVLGAALAGVPILTTHRTMAWPVEDVPARRHCFGLLPGLHLHRRKVVFKTWLTAALARAVVYNSDQVRAGYEEQYCYPRGKGVVIVNAVDAPQEPIVTPEPRSAGEPAPEKPCTIGYVGRISREKRLDVLIRALAAMRTARQVRLMLCGEGPEQPRLAALAGELQVAERITWAGLTWDVWPAYAQCDIVTLCSPRESSSNMVLEAMAAGKAVVVTRAGGLPELTDGGRLGVCVPALDVNALASALTYLIEHDDFRRQLGDRARRAVLARHNASAIAAQWRSLLRQAAGRRWWGPHLGRITPTSDNQRPQTSPALYGCVSAVTGPSGRP